MAITAKCPYCESEAIREICRVTDAQDVIEWMLTPDGTPTPADYGCNETFYDTTERIGYDCADCGRDISKPVFYADGVKIK